MLVFAKLNQLTGFELAMCTLPCHVQALLSFYPYISLYAYPGKRRVTSEELGVKLCVACTIHWPGKLISCLPNTSKKDPVAPKQIHTKGLI